MSDTTAPKALPITEQVELILQSPSGLAFVAKFLASQKRELFLVGNDTINRQLLELLAGLDRKTTGVNWTFGEAAPDQIPGNCLIIVTEIPRRTEDWRALSQMTARYHSRVNFIHQLGLKAMTYAMFFEKLPVFLEPIRLSDPLEALDYYLGPNFLGESLKKLARIYPFEGKHIIEFGPWAGLHTAFLVHNSASKVTCVEGRSENILRMAIINELFGWSNVELIQMDYHYADANTLGRYDFVFAHGVHYHSIAPILLMERWLALADNMYYGAWCATDEKATGDWRTLTYQGRDLRVKTFEESSGQLDGLYSFGYMFHVDDLKWIFTSHGWNVNIVSEENVENYGLSKYIRFLAVRGPG